MSGSSSSVSFDDFDAFMAGCADDATHARVAEVLSNPESPLSQLLNGFQEDHESPLYVSLEAAGRTVAISSESTSKGELSVRSDATKREALSVLRNAIGVAHPENPAVAEILNVWVQIFEQTTTYHPPAPLSAAQLASVQQSRSPIWRYRKLHIAVTLALAIAAIVFATLWFAKRNEQSSDENKTFDAFKLTDRNIVVQGDISRPLLYKASGFRHAGWAEFPVSSMNDAAAGVCESIKRVLPRDGHNERGHFFVILVPEFEGYLTFRQGEEDVTVVVGKDFANGYLEQVTDHIDTTRNQLLGMCEYIIQSGNPTPQGFRGTLGWLSTTQEWKKRDEDMIAELQAKIEALKATTNADHTDVTKNDIVFLEGRIRVHKRAAERLTLFESEMTSHVESMAEQYERNDEKND